MAGQQVRREEIEWTRALLTRVVDNVETVIRGKRDVVELVVLALVAKGHVLLEDLPGTGKTTLVSTLARSVACDFNRIQFTPDIMPSDVSGFSIFNQKTREFEFRPGGVMSNLVLADEINRASAKTQSALLEAMEERQVTVDSNTYRLPEPFMVLATQNPIEQFGTYPLPEAQLDRFLVKLSMGYPAFNQEVEVLKLGDSNKQALRAVASSNDVLAARDVASRVLAVDIVVRYIVEIITATRNHPEIQVGSSPRGGLALLALSRAYALLQGRGYVVPDDVKRLAPFVLNHRIALAHDAKVAGRTPQDVVASILSSISVPIMSVEGETVAPSSTQPVPEPAAQVVAQPAPESAVQAAYQPAAQAVSQPMAVSQFETGMQQGSQMNGQATMQQMQAAQPEVQQAQSQQQVQEVRQTQQQVQPTQETRQPQMQAQSQPQSAQQVQQATVASERTQPAAASEQSRQFALPSEQARQAYPSEAARKSRGEQDEPHPAQDSHIVINLDDYIGSDKSIRLF